jgi:hypothetical protein
LTLQKDKVSKMAGIIKPIGTSVSCNSINTNTFSNATLVRLTCSLALTSGHTVTSKTPATFNSNTGVDSTEDFITLSPQHYFVDGDAVLYTTSTGNTALTGITNNTTYYITSSNTTGVKLAANTLNAATRVANNITKSVTESGHNLTRTNFTIFITGGQSLILVKNPVDVLTSSDVSTTQLVGTGIAYRD